MADVNSWFFHMRWYIFVYINFFFFGKIWSTMHLHDTYWSYIRLLEPERSFHCTSMLATVLRSYRSFHKCTAWVNVDAAWFSHFMKFVHQLLLICLRWIILLGSYTRMFTIQPRHKLSVQCHFMHIYCTLCIYSSYLFRLLFLIL